MIAVSDFQLALAASVLLALIGIIGVVSSPKSQTVWIVSEAYTSGSTGKVSRDGFIVAVATSKLKALEIIALNDDHQHRWWEICECTVGEKAYQMGREMFTGGSWKAELIRLQGRPLRLSKP